MLPIRASSRFGPLARRPYLRRPLDLGPRRSPWAHTETIQTNGADPHARPANLARLEAVLFSTDEPLTLRRLTEVAGLKDATETRRVLAQLQEHLKSTLSAFEIGEMAGGYQLLTRPVFHPWLARIRRPGHMARLTPASMETLTVLAYKQPLTRADLDGVRGVDCGEMVSVSVSSE